MRILLTEDHPDTARFMRLILEKHGLEVCTANSFQEAVQLADNEPFDLLISDIRLPDGDGFALCKDLHERHQLRSICLSGEIAAGSPQSDGEAPFTACLPKPVDVPYLLQVIEQVTGWKTPPPQ
jgi:two-component system CheB/CheR fusion protein